MLVKAIAKVNKKYCIIQHGNTIVEPQTNNSQHLQSYRATEIPQRFLQRFTSIFRRHNYG